MSGRQDRVVGGIGVGIAVLVAGVGAVVGWYEDVPTQHVIFFTAATFALVLWVWSYCTGRWMGMPPAEASASAGAPSADAVAGGDEEEAHDSRQPVREWLWRHRITLIGLAIILAGYIILALVSERFLTGLNTLSALILAGLLIIATNFSKVFQENRSAFIGICLLIGLFVIGSLTIEGFSSYNNIRSMLVFSAFLGLACIGQTFVVLLGGLDLSIPFLIGAANIGLMYLFGLGVPAWLAILFVIFLGGLIGVINGLLSFRIQGQALILTLGVGFAVSGGVQIITSLGSRYAGNVHGAVPGWLTNLAAMNGTTFGLPFPPVIAIWVILALLLIVGMKNTVYGRCLYALGGNRTAAERLSISERRYWVMAYTVSGCTSALTGILLLGWSGGGFVGVGDPYLFSTLAAVVIGGTSLLGGWGGYGFTVIGVLVLQVLTSFLVGIGLGHYGQQFVFGLLILPMVALYARSPHIRTQI